ncbi:hypothetical protein [Streptomyces sp. NPDC050535]
MIDVWEDLGSLAEVQVIATDEDDRATRSSLETAVAFRRQLVSTLT